jgi:hypothetical protein
MVCGIFGLSCYIRSFVLLFQSYLLDSLAGPVTIADQSAKESMSSIILENFPSHAV